MPTSTGQIQQTSALLVTNTLIKNLLPLVFFNPFHKQEAFLFSFFLGTVVVKVKK